MGGVEYCQYRIYESTADVDGDSIDDFLVVFAVEAPAGGNNSTQFLAAFASGSNWAPSAVQVAQRGQRIVEGVEADGRTIVLQTLEYAKGDAMCCPSIESEARFQIKGGQIVASSPSRPTKR
ncbi:MAG: LppP/LprE family lipoprotein [bacterium]